MDSSIRCLAFFLSLSWSFKLLLKSLQPRYFVFALFILRFELSNFCFVTWLLLLGAFVSFDRYMEGRSCLVSRSGSAGACWTFKVALRAEFLLFDRESYERSVACWAWALTNLLKFVVSGWVVMLWTEWVLSSPLKRDRPCIWLATV